MAPLIDSQGSRLWALVFIRQLICRIISWNCLQFTFMVSWCGMSWFLFVHWMRKKKKKALFSLRLVLGCSLLVASPACGSSGACCPWFWQLTIGFPYPPPPPLALGHWFVIAGRVGGGVHFVNSCVSNRVLPAPSAHSEHASILECTSYLSTVHICMLTFSQVWHAI